MFPLEQINEKTRISFKGKITSKTKQKTIVLTMNCYVHARTWLTLLFQLTLEFKLLVTSAVFETAE